MKEMDSVEVDVVEAACACREVDACRESYYCFCHAAHHKLEAIFFGLLV